jgi:hypothetical protein
MFAQVTDIAILCLSFSIQFISSGNLNYAFSKKDFYSIFVTVKTQIQEWLFFRISGFGWIFMTIHLSCVREFETGSVE